MAILPHLGNEFWPRRTASVHICPSSSCVVDKIMLYGWIMCFSAEFRFNATSLEAKFKIGSRYAAVFPDPVGAPTRRWWPCIAITVAKNASNNWLPNAKNYSPDHREFFKMAPWVEPWAGIDLSLHSRRAFDHRALVNANHDYNLTQIPV